MPEALTLEEEKRRERMLEEEAERMLEEELKLKQDEERLAREKAQRQEEGISPKAEANVRGFQARAQQDYERRQQEAASSERVLARGRVTEEAAEMPARAPRFKSPLQVVDDYTARSRELEGFEAYNALIDARQDLLHSSLLNASPKLKRSYLKGTKANRDKINQAIFEAAREKRGVVLDGFVVTPEEEAKWHPGQRHVPAGKPARMAPLYDHGTELHFQALINKDAGWDEYEDKDFMERACLPKGSPARKIPSMTWFAPCTIWRGRTLA